MTLGVYAPILKSVNQLTQITNMKKKYSASFTLDILEILDKWKNHFTRQGKKRASKKDVIVQAVLEYDDNHSKELTKQ